MYIVVRHKSTLLQTIELAGSVTSRLNRNLTDYTNFLLFM